MHIVKLVSLILTLLILAACNQVNDAVLSNVHSDDEHSDGSKAHAHSHDYTVDPATTVDISDPEVLKEEALKDSEFVSTLNEDELAFVKEIRPLHFDIKTMALRVSGSGVLYFTGDADINQITHISEDASIKFEKMKEEIEKLTPPPSMEDIQATYISSIDLYKESIEHFKNFFQTEEPKYLEEFKAKSDKANNQIKGVIFRMWTDEFNPH